MKASTVFLSVIDVSLHVIFDGTKLISYHMDYVHMPLYLSDVEKALVLVPRSCAGVPFHRKTLMTDASLMGWGVFLDGY